jgi:hypothetical protein
MGSIGHQCKQSCKQAHAANKRLSMIESSVSVPVYLRQALANRGSVRTNFNRANNELFL